MYAALLLCLVLGGNAQADLGKSLVPPSIHEQTHINFWEGDRFAEIRLHSYGVQVTVSRVIGWRFEAGILACNENDDPWSPEWEVFSSKWFSLSTERREAIDYLATMLDDTQIKENRRKLEKVLRFLCEEE